jgi:ATP-binding protein involved in chromosome partitioning
MYPCDSVEEVANEPRMPAAHPSILKVIEQKKRVKEKLSGIKHKIGIYSAKGGVGKTTTAVNIAYTLKEMGYKVGLLDADVDCPNLTMFLGISEILEGNYPLIPVEKDGIKVLSTAMFVDDVKRPIIWRGPMIGKMIAEFFENSEWGDLDYLVIDLPPGTSDAPLSIIQLLDLDGFILVTTPQHIATVNTMRSGGMARRLGAGILGVVENMSDGSGDGGKTVAKGLECDFLGMVKSNQRFNELSDKGRIPVLEDQEIRKEYIEIVNKIVGR